MQLFARDPFIHMLPPDTNIEEAPCVLATMISPGVLTAILVHTKIRRYDDTLGEPWNNNRDVAGGRDHRMTAIGITLLREARMRMNVRDDIQPSHAPAVREHSARDGVADARACAGYYRVRTIQT